MTNPNFQYKIYIKNRKALYDYSVEQKYIAGIALIGCEVKSVKQKKADLTDSYITITKHLEAFVNNLTIQKYDGANSKIISLNNSTDPRRQRKLLLQKKEIAKLYEAVNKTGKTIVPLSMFYSHKHLVKLEIALVKPLKKYDKRQKLKDKDIQKDLKRQINEI